ncbi:eukaryotic release factor 1 [Thamnocephalis sphaerospora]|uniref:Eukaryotic release factor 1 n=1 Tax=Thamnocephalis sphaerospora TaxID=78915 RepID=A0A4P9XFT8_9FUNG|nr:eukaryotic release factor 1 [Thamnocephalis sphaerospora]|eukprot:RKP04473.1 eukaryotic release factor 1 [Thamnocephalis sphaerospora]
MSHPFTRASPLHLATKLFGLALLLPPCINISFEPFRPINTSLYLCDNKFHTEALQELLESDSRFGFIVMDGNGTLFGTLSGNTREVLHKYPVELPKKHGRGGQSALRFARLREESRHNYVRKVAELAVQFFITQDKVNVTGLVLAGSADFKSVLSTSDMFDQRLQAKVLKLVDVSYGGENGFNQAIELSAEVLSNVKFALDLGAVHTLIIYENLDVIRYVVKNQAGEEIVLHLTPEQAKDRSRFMDPVTSQEMEVVSDMQLLEWFTESYKDFGAALEFVTNRSQEGAQFVKGFGGIGGLLRYKVNFEQMEYDSDEFFSD